MEEWKDVPGYDDYQVSNLGNVYSKRFSKIMKKRINVKNKYEIICLRSPERITVNVHKLIMLAFIGECPDGHEVDHINHIRDDNRLENLRYLPILENRQKTSRVNLDLSEGSQEKNMKRREVVVCECGVEVSISNLSRHRKSKRHQQ